MKKIVLEGKGLCKTFINGQISTNVIRNLDMEVYEGDFTVIMGTSGAGKSTLLYMLSGIDTVTSGEVHIKDLPLHTLKEKQMAKIRQQEIGLVFQEPNLLEDFNAYDNIALSGYLTNKNRKEVHQKVDQLLEQIDMTEHQHKLPSQLSGGQKQRLSIARSLINQPAIVFADEPTGALNATQSENVLDMLTAIHEDGQTVLMVTHDIKAAARANQLLFIKDGKIDGILELDQFDTGSVKDREKQIFDFIMSKGW